MEFIVGTCITGLKDTDFDWINSAPKVRLALPYFTPENSLVLMV